MTFKYLIVTFNNVKGDFQEVDNYMNKDIEELAKQIYVKWISKEFGLSYGTYVSMAMEALSVASAFYEGLDKMKNIDPPPLSKSKP